MGFDITSDDLPDKMYQGMIISYQVKPVFGIPTTWVTEITHVQDKSYFVDEQRVGPYKLWHHQHKLEATEIKLVKAEHSKWNLGFTGMLIGVIATLLIVK